MNPEVVPKPGLTARNGAARACFIASIVFLLPTASMLVSNGVALSSWGGRFLKANPDHAITFFFELVFEVTFLGIPFCFFASLIVILIGIRGLVASRSRGGAGGNEATLGIGLSALVMALCVAGFFQWASAFRQ